MTVMKIALIVNDLVPISGVGRVVINLASILKNYGYKIKIFTINCDSQFINRYGITDSDIVCYNKLTILDKMIKIPVLGFLMQLIKFILFGIIVSKRLLREKPTIINSHYYFLGLSGLISSKITNIPHILTIHGIRLSKTNMNVFHYWIDYLILNTILRHVRYFITVDPSLQTLIQFKKLSDRIRVIYPCIDRMFLEHLQQIEVPKHKSTYKIKKGVKLIYVGRLEKHKGVDELLRQLAENKTYWAELKLVGSGSYEVQLRKLIKKLSISSKVNFLGILDGMEKIQEINDSDIFISYSRSEGFPLIILECFALGKPCIIYPIGGITFFRDEFEQKKLGIFLKPTKDFLKHILTYPYLSQFFNQEPCNARRQFIKHFTPESMASQYIEWFEKILEGNKKR